MSRHRKLVVNELLTKPSAIAPMLFVGLGGCGCKMVAGVAKHLRRRPDYAERYRPLIKFALIDTNVNDLESARDIADETFLISDFEKEEYANLAAGKLFLEADPYFTQWVPQDYRFRAGDTAGAGQIRIESRLGIFYQMKHKDFRPRLRRMLEDLKSHELGHRRLDSPEIRIVLCYSVAGGTGSGCHLPLAYLLKDLASDLGQPRTIGVAVLPAVFEDKTKSNKDGTYANGYAALKETEHLMKLGAPDSRFFLPEGITFHYDPGDESKRVVRDKPFEFVYVIDKPQSFSVPDPVAAAADGLYLQFFSPLFARQSSDYDNYTQHQRFLVPHDFESKGIEGFSTFYGSYGAAVLLVPAEGLIDYCAQATALHLMQASFLRGVPGDPVYQSLRIHREPFDEVTLADGTKNDRPIHVSEFGRRPPGERERLIDRLFMKRVRLLASCEDVLDEEKRYLPLFRHGHRSGERPTRDGRYELREDVVLADRKLLVDDGAKRSIGALVLEALAGARPGEEPGLLLQARRAVDAAAERVRAPQGDNTVGELVSLVRRRIDDLKDAGVRTLENGYIEGTLAFPGLKSLVELDYLREEAASVELAAKRYAVLSILDQVNWELQVPAPRSDLDVGERKESERVKQRDAEEVMRHLLGHAADRAMERVQRHFAERLSDLKRSLQELAAIQRTLDSGFEDLERDALYRLDRLRAEGDSSANQYVLDAEALQIEDGRRMWDFYYVDRVADLPELSLGNERVQQVLSDTVADLAVTGGARATSSATLDKLFTSLRQHAQAVLRPRVAGDPRSPDRERRDGLTLATALELEVLYRALYRSNSEEVDRPDGLKAIRHLVAEYRALPPDAEGLVHVGQLLHRDYLRDKIKRVVKEKASLLCVYDDSRDQHGGVRPDDVFLAAISEDFQNGTIADVLRNADIENLEWVSDGWHDPKEIVFYRATLNVPLYVFGRLGEMKHYYHQFKSMAKRPKVLHVDKNWEDSLPDLDPVSSKEKHRQQLVREQIVNFAALLTIAHPSDPTGTCIEREDASYYLRDPVALGPSVAGNGHAEGASDRVFLGASTTAAIERLPEVLESEKVKYLAFQQMLKPVREGLAPKVLRRITRLPFVWRRNHDELKQQYGAHLDAVQRERLKDYTDSFGRLQEALAGLLERLANREIEQRTLDGELEDAMEVDPGRQALRQSIQILRAFQETWQVMENPEKGGHVSPSFRDLFSPLTGEQLKEALDRLRNGFGAAGEKPAPVPPPAAAGGSERRRARA